MKNNLLTEIERIKDIMFLNEGSNQECEKQLEDDGYIVYNHTEQNINDSMCINNPKIKCVKEWLDTNEIDSKNYHSGNHRGVCYIFAKSSTTIKHDTEEMSKKTYAFWDNGDVTMIRTFDLIQTDTIAEDVKYSQAQYKGKYECEGSKIIISGFRYQGMYHYGNTTDLLKNVPADFKVKVPNSDTNGDYEVYKGVPTNFILSKTNFK